MASGSQHSYPVPVEDLDLAVDMVGSHWARLDGMRLFFTGGTGFVGIWMVSVLLRALDRGLLRAEATLLTRDAGKFSARAPEIASHRSVRTMEGDVLGEGWSLDGCSHLVAGATEASAAMIREQPRLMLETIVDGTRRTLDRAASFGVSRAMFISSGAVNGPQFDTPRASESDFFGPDPLSLRSVYAEGKRLGEMLFALSANSSFSVSIARLWAFVGPLLPLDTHFAAGNFLRDAMAGAPIRILGDGTTVRSYQYASDMAAWNWVILASGRETTAYNVGSDHGVTTLELARLCDRLAGGAGIEVLGTPDPSRRIDRYVPDTGLFRREFAFGAGSDLAESLSKTILWHRKGNRQ